MKKAHSIDLFLAPASNGVNLAALLLSRLDSQETTLIAPSARLLVVAREGSVRLGLVLVYNVVDPVAASVMAVVDLDLAAVGKLRRATLLAALFVSQPLEAMRSKLAESKQKEKAKKIK